MVQSKEDKELHDSVEALKKDLASLREDLRSVATHAVGAGQQHASAASHEVGEQFRSTFDQVQAQARKHPLETAGIALGVGFLLGKLLSLPHHNR